VHTKISTPYNSYDIITKAYNLEHLISNLPYLRITHTNLIIKCRIGCAIIFRFIEAKNFSIALATVQFFNEEKTEKNKLICGILLSTWYQQ